MDSLITKSFSVSHSSISHLDTVPPGYIGKLSVYLPEINGRLELYLYINNQTVLDKVYEYENGGKNIWLNQGEYISFRNPNTSGTPRGGRYSLVLFKLE